MNTAKIYHDSDGNECSIVQMVKREPEWSAVRIQEGEKAIEQLADRDAEIDKTLRLLRMKHDLIDEMDAEIERLKGFCIWMTGCGYDFCQHDYFIKLRDKLLKQNLD